LLALAISTAGSLGTFAEHPVQTPDGKTVDSSSLSYTQTDEINNIAVSVNQVNNSTVSESACGFVSNSRPTIDNGNGAIAIGACSNCHTVAIAVQVVLVQGSPTTVAPQNVAVAANGGCSHCDTLAVAYQFVEGGGGHRWTLSRPAQEQMDRIGDQIQAIADHPEMTDQQILDRVAELAARIHQVLATDLQMDVRTDRKQDVDKRD
jgi:hypothetical protein